MPQVVIENPILNLPFAEPQRHFHFDDEGIADIIVNSRVRQLPSPAPAAPGAHGSSASSPAGKPLSEGLPPLPEGLAAQLQGLGRRAKPAAIRAAVPALCGHHPMRPADLGVILGRDPGYLRETYLTPLVEAWELEYTHPENPAHPQQAYRVRQGKPEAQP